MKSNKGMSVTALIIYIIVFTVVVGTSSMLVRFFYRNSEDVLLTSNASSKYSRFLLYITNDINSRKSERYRSFK